MKVNWELYAIKFKSNTRMCEFHAKASEFIARHRQCDASPTVTFSAIEHHCCLTGTKLYCLVTEALARGHHMKVEWLGVEPATY